MFTKRANAKAKSKKQKERSTFNVDKSEKMQENKEEKVMGVDEKRDKGERA